MRCKFSKVGDPGQIRISIILIMRKNITRFWAGFLYWLSQILSWHEHMAPKNVELHPHPWPFWGILKNQTHPGIIRWWQIPYIYIYIHWDPHYGWWTWFCLNTKKNCGDFPIDSLIPQWQIQVNPGENHHVFQENSPIISTLCIKFQPWPMAWMLYD